MSDTDAPADSPALDIVDETFLAVPPSTVAAAFADPRSWSVYWPDLVLEVYTDRGDRGLRWTVRGALVGTMEVWLEPVLDGTVLHYFLRARLAGGLLGARSAGGSLGARLAGGFLGARSAGGAGRRPRDLAREADRRARAAKAVALELKDVLEDGRRPGVPPVSITGG